MLRITIWIALVISAAVAAVSPRVIPFHTRTMGTWGTVNIAGNDSIAVADPALSSLLVFHHVDSLMSNWTETSEVARINREAGKSTITIDREVADVIATSLEVSRATLFRARARKKSITIDAPMTTKAGMVASTACSCPSRRLIAS